MLLNALMLAVLGSIDSLLTSLVADNITGTQHKSDRELLGQGLGNALAGLFGGIAGAGATMRTVVNIRAGGSGPLSGVVHALVLLAVATGLGFLFESIPLAALAGILIKVGIDIIDWPFIQRLHRLPRFPVALMLLVLLLTVFVDLITAVFVGVFIKNLVTVNKLSDLELGSVVMSDGSSDLDRLKQPERELLERHAGSAVLLRITGPVSYAVGRGINARFEPYRDHAFLFIDIADAAIVGISTVMVLENLIRNARANGVAVRLIGADREAHRELQQLGLVDLVGRENCLASVTAAL
jgi:SulP family sulfate permease